MKENKHSFQTKNKPLIMGILNITPDSFSDGGKWINQELAIEHTKKMILEGAKIIDIGGESTRPGFTKVSPLKEIQRVIPIIKAIKPFCNKNKITISIDTSKAEVAEVAANAGATFLNDIHGLQKDSAMADIAAKYNLKVCIMHNRDSASDKIDIISDIMNYFEKSIKIATKAGIKTKNIILDPGIGFGKTLNQNYIVLNNLSQFHQFEFPLLLGCSRKSLIGRLDQSPVTERIGGTVATTIMGINAGVKIFRVHDVHENRQALEVYQSIIKQEAILTEITKGLN